MVEKNRPQPSRRLAVLLRSSNRAAEGVLERLDQLVILNDLFGGQRFADGGVAEAANFSAELKVLSAELKKSESPHVVSYNESKRRAGDRRPTFQTPAVKQKVFAKRNTTREQASGKQRRT